MHLDQVLVGYDGRVHPADMGGSQKVEISIQEGNKLWARVELETA